MKREESSGPGSTHGVYTPPSYFAGSGYRELPSDAVLLAGFGIPALLLFFKHPIHRLRHRTKGAGLGFTAIMTFLMEWIVELLEIFSGYLANTLSFMRVAGLGIAHVSLMTAFDQIASMASPSGSFSFWSLLILLTGNILVIALEGLSAGIQSLRLNYYEFFSKYFTGSGRAYAPISLRSSNVSKEHTMDVRKKFRQQVSMRLMIMVIVMAIISLVSVTGLFAETGQAAAEPAAAADPGVQQFGLIAAALAFGLGGHRCEDRYKPCRCGSHGRHWGEA